MRLFWFSFSLLLFTLLWIFGLNFIWPGNTTSSEVLPAAEEEIIRSPLSTPGSGGKFLSDYESTLPGFLVEPLTSEFSLFDGQKISAEDAEGEYLMGVMIDNSGPARKMQVGLDESSLVVEALAEGGVTRFLAFFSSRQELEKIGPIRSARPYFFDMARPFHALYVHAGGSDTVMVELSNQDDIFDVDHHILGNNGDLFWRDTTYYAPHNLFTSSAGLKRHLEEADDSDGFAVLSEKTFDFSLIPIRSEEEATLITTSFSIPLYNASWTWDSEEKVYRRSQSSLALDIGVQNLVIMEADMWRIANDPKGRMGMKNVGSGDMYLFQDGKFVRGVWQKESRSDPLTFYDENGLELTFLRGKTWIAIVDDFQKFSYQ